MQREGQAHSPTKSEWDSADVKAYRAYRCWDYEKQMGQYGFGDGWRCNDPCVCVGKENLIRALPVLTICGLNVMIKVI